MGVLLVVGCRPTCAAARHPDRAGGSRRGGASASSSSSTTAWGIVSKPSSPRAYSRSSTADSVWKMSQVPIPLAAARVARLPTPPPVAAALHCTPRRRAGARRRRSTGGGAACTRLASRRDSRQQLHLPLLLRLHHTPKIARCRPGGRRSRARRRAARAATRPRAWPCAASSAKSGDDISRMRFRNKPAHLVSLCCRLKSGSVSSVMV